MKKYYALFAFIACLVTAGNGLFGQNDCIADPGSPQQNVAHRYLDGQVQGKHSINQALDGLDSEGVFHLFSHGRSGELLLEGEWRQAPGIAAWLKENTLLSGCSHLNIYGCNFAEGREGRAAVEYLETALGVSVAASDDVTGSGGDWDLEVGAAKGSIHPIDYAYSLQACDLSITTVYSGNCSGDDATGYTADWNIGIAVSNAPDTDISFQRNSDAVQGHVLTGSTDTLTVAGIPADGGAYDTLKVWFDNDVTCADTIIVKRPVPCPAPISFTYPCPDNNVAPTGAATQSSTLSNGFCPGSSCSANLAIDGNTNGVFSGGSVAHTNGEATPWWMVDLGTSYDIEEIVLWNRTDACCSDRLDNAIVEILDASDNVLFTYTLGVAVVRNSIPVGLVNGQKVRVRKSGTTEYVSLAEVEVFAVIPGSCADGAGEICNADGGMGADEIAGSVWEDWNYDGTMNEGTIIGVQGIQVLAYDCDGNLVGTTYTDANGNYQFAGLTSGEDYRIEFVLPETVSSWASLTNAGADNGTSVQFVQAGECANLGVAASSDYCQSNPTIINPCYLTGEASSPAAQADNALVLIPFDNSAPQTYVGTVSDFGSVNGVAWQAEKQRVFLSSFLKRYVGFANGPGYVYMVDEPEGGSPVITNFDLQGVVPQNGGPAIDLGSVCRQNATDGNPDDSCDPYGTGLPSDYTLVTDPTAPSIDMDAFLKIGTISFGDMDYDAANEALWLVNLYQKALIQIDVSGTSASLPGTVNQYPISSLAGAPTCSTGELRPWGLKIYRGRGYLGLVCDASISQNTADLMAYVLSFDINNIAAGFVQELAMALDFPRETTFVSSSGATNLPADWLPWLTTRVGDDSYPQPILSDIEFTTSGDLILGFMDRMAHQGGIANYEPFSGSTTVQYGYPGGDLLKACNVNGTFVLEGFGCESINDLHTSNYGVNNDGPAGIGEFFWEDFTGNNGHNEITFGSLAILNNVVVSTAFNPTPSALGGDIFSNGLRWYNTETGRLTDYLTTVTYSIDGSRSGKAGSIGDLELLCGLAPIEIGNYVWEDTNGNGIQEACENGISGVTVELYDVSGTTLIATTTTDANGQYYFSGQNATDLNLIWSGTGADTTLLANTAYVIRIPNAEGSSQQTALDGFELTVSDADGNNSDNIDNDASLNGTSVEISMTTGNYGSANHTYDFGFEYFDLALRKTVASQSDTPLIPGTSTVTFELKVYNQGGIAADSIELTDYIPVGLTLADANWVMSGSDAVRTLSVANGDMATALAPGDSITVQISLSVDAGVEGVITNFAEISRATDESGNPVTDIDSTPDSDPNNETGVINDEINDDGTLDEDDHDLECISIPVELCEGQGATLEAPLAGSYQWYKDGLALAGENGQSLVVAFDASGNFEGDYQVVLDGGVLGSCGSQNCCPVTLVTGICPPDCPTDRCIPGTMMKVAP